MGSAQAQGTQKKEGNERKKVPVLSLLPKKFPLLVVLNVISSNNLKSYEILSYALAHTSTIL